MKIKTELPTEPGAYWWRKSKLHNWDMRVLTSRDMRILPLGWENENFGFWARVPTPDEAESDPVRVAAEAMLTAFKNAEHNWHDYVQTLDEALEATK